MFTPGLFTKLFQRRKFIIKPQLQLKYLAVTVIIVILTAFVTYYFINLSISTTPILENLSTTEIIMVKKLILKTIITVTIIIVILIISEGIFFLHRLTGPIYVIQKMINLVAEGDLTIEVKLRKSDELKDLAQEFQKMVNKLNKYITEDKQKVDKIKIQLNDIVSNIESLSSEEIKMKLNHIQQSLTELFISFKLK